MEWNTLNYKAQGTSQDTYACVISAISFYSGTASFYFQKHFDRHVTYFIKTDLGCVVSLYVLKL